MSPGGNPKSTVGVDRAGRRHPNRLRPGCESLETRTVLSAIKIAPVASVPPPPTADPFNSAAYAITQFANTNPGDPAASPAIRAAEAANQLTPYQVEQLLNRASAATPSKDGIVAIVDRSGRILGVRMESGVSPAITNNTSNLVYAVDGALAEARTGAFFGNNQAPLTSRTIQDLSQTTMTQQEINSNPSVTDPNSPFKGPGFVAPIGIKGHFPPGVPFTPQVDLFAIEHTNRDTTIVPSTGAVRPNRYNVPDAYIPAAIKATNTQIAPPDSYGYISGLEPNALPRGIGTLPGGLPIVKTVYVNGVRKSIVLGGIGVFFPGTTGAAIEENSSLNQNGFNPKKVDRSLEAELVAFAALGGASGAKVLVGRPTTIGTYANTPPVPGLDLLPQDPKGNYTGRIDLVGVTLDVFGPQGNQGPITLFKDAPSFGLTMGTVNGVDLPIAPGQTAMPFTPTPMATQPPVAPTTNTKTGTIVPSGWLVEPHAGGGLTTADVIQIVANGILRASVTRAAIRLPIGQHARMVFAVSDEQGNLLGLYRMPDATYFSIDVAVAKARNVAYYNDPNQLQPQDQVKNLPKGEALTARTFRYLALPHFPEGIDVYPAGPFSILNDQKITGASIPASSFQSVQGYDAFNPQTNFRAQTNPANQNGIVFFPGSTGLYKTINGKAALVGGLGVSGDGVDQDDDVTFSAAIGYRAPGVIQVDQLKVVRGVRLPYQKFNRNNLA
jgi:uncharacterized protein GlcG (DUF336 family)